MSSLGGSDTASKGERLRRLEIVGAWLRLWTPPKGAEVPPVPTRKLAAGGLALSVVVGVGLVLLIPALQDTRERNQKALSAEHRATVKAAERRLRAEQRLHSVHVAAGSYAALIPRLEHAITRDARARFAAHELPNRVAETQCEPAPGKAAYPDSRVYKCTALTAATGLPVRTGYPFVATVFAGRGRLNWCKYSLTPGEGSADHPLAHVRLTSRCAGDLSKSL
jgi:hypothetical protein